MTHEAQEPVSEDLRALIAFERARPGLSDARAARLLGQIVGRAAHEPAPPDRATPAARLRGLSPYATFALGGVLGAVVGAAGYARWRPLPAPRVERVIERVIERVEVQVPDRVQAPVSQDASAVTPPVELPAPRPALAPTPVDVREQESALLERARAAMLRRRPADALDALDEHARRFPRGRLAEEREALAVQALAAAGDHAGASARARRFHQQHPGSPLGAVVDAVTRSP